MLLNLFRPRIRTNKSIKISVRIQSKKKISVLFLFIYLQQELYIYTIDTLLAVLANNVRAHAQVALSFIRVILDLCVAEEAGNGD